MQDESERKMKKLFLFTIFTLLSGCLFAQSSGGQSGGIAPAGDANQVNCRESSFGFRALDLSGCSGANLTLGGTLSGMTQLTVENVRLDNHTISDLTGDLIITNSTGANLFTVVGTSVFDYSTGTHIEQKLHKGAADNFGTIGFYTATARKFALQHDNNDELLITRESGNYIKLSTTGKAIFSTGLDINDSGARPTCDSTVRGTFWVDEGAGGVADSVAVCAKDSGDAYAWRTIY